MSESASQGFPDKSVVHRPNGEVTDEALEAALGAFRHWFQEARCRARVGVSEDNWTIDRTTLLSQYVALRQELNLQTRAVRAQQEQHGELLAKLESTLELLAQQRAPRKEMTGEDQQEAIRPLLTTLIELHDALSRADREMQRAKGIFEAPAEAVKDWPCLAVPEAQRRSIWERWWRGEVSDREETAWRERVTLLETRFREEREARLRERANADRLKSILGSLAVGYTLSLERLERAISQQGLEPIQAKGKRFDPNLMEVLEAVTGSEEASGTVVEEVRRGYTWNGRIFRYALVRVARS